MPRGVNAYPEKMDCDGLYLSGLDSTAPGFGGIEILRMNIACHYTRPPRNYDLRIKSSLGCVPFVTG
jgi:hypothetical protein